MDKSKLFHILRDLYKEQHDQNAQDQDDGSLDAMVLVQELAGMNDFSAAFMAILTRAIFRYTTVHLVFDQNNRTTSLKQTTRERDKSSTGRTSYTGKYSTPIRMYLKLFLSESKRNAKKTLDYFRSSHKTVVVSTRDGVKTNKTNKNVMSVTGVPVRRRQTRFYCFMQSVRPVKMKMQQTTSSQRTLMFYSLL